MSLSPSKAQTLVLQVVSVAAIVPGALALTKIPSSQSPSNQLTVGKVSAAIVLCVAVVGLILEAAAIIVRFLNIGLLNLKSRLCLTVVCFFFEQQEYVYEYMYVCDSLKLC